MVNNSPIPLMIFPYQKLAQLLIEKTGENRHPYTGTYCQERTYTLPTVKKTDLIQYSDDTKERILQKKPKKTLYRKTKKSPLVIIIANVVISTVFTVFMGVFGIRSDIFALVSFGIAGSIVEVVLAIIEYRWIGNKDD